MRKDRMGLCCSITRATCGLFCALSHTETVKVPEAQDDLMYRSEGKFTAL